MCHANDAGTTMREVIDLDKAVKVAEEFAAQHPDETLIVVTGDHETGGLTLGFADTGYSSYIERLQYQKCSQDEFSGKLQEVADDYEGVKSAITEWFGLKFDGEDDDPMQLTDAEKNEIRDAYDRSGENHKEISRVTHTVVKIFDNKAGLGWTSGAHTALPVNTSAKGVGADLFKGMIDNTDVAKKLKSLIL